MRAFVSNFFSAATLLSFAKFAHTVFLGQVPVYLYCICVISNCICVIMNLNLCILCRCALYLLLLHHSFLRKMQNLPAPYFVGRSQCICIAFVQLEIVFVSLWTWNCVFLCRCALYLLFCAQNLCPILQTKDKQLNCCCYIRPTYKLCKERTHFKEGSVSFQPPKFSFILDKYVLLQFCFSFQSNSHRMGHDRPQGPTKREHCPQHL